MKVTKQLRKKAFSLGNEFLFIGVILVCFIVIKVIPFLSSITYSFTDWNGVTDVINFNWIDNFIKLGGDKQFWKSFLFTFSFCAVTLVGTNLVGFTCAFFLTKPIKFRNFLRMGYYVPNILDGLVLGFIWQFIFVKVVPALGDATGFPLFNLMWLGTPATSFWALAIVDIWRVSGFYMLLYIAGLTAIPIDCIESTRIDGANSWQVLTKVTIPLMMPTITRCLFLSIISGFNIYTLNLSLTNGGPYNSSEAISMNIYRTAFTENAMGYGSAKALVFMLIVILITSLQFYLTSRKEVEM